MNRSEATTLTRVVKAICPSQLIDDETPTAWEMALFDISAADAMEAVRRIARRPSEPGKEYRYIEPGHIRWEVGKLREERIENHPEPEPPYAMTEAEHRAWYRDVRRRIADGETIEQPQIEARPMPELEMLIKRVDDAV